MTLKQNCYMDLSIRLAECLCVMKYHFLCTRATLLYLQLESCRLSTFLCAANRRKGKPNWNFFQKKRTVSPTWHVFFWHFTWREYEVFFSANCRSFVASFLDCASNFNRSLCVLPHLLFAEIQLYYRKSIVSFWVRVDRLTHFHEEKKNTRHFHIAYFRVNILWFFY